MKSTPRAGQKRAGPRGAQAGQARTPASSTRTPAGQARGAKGHFFTGPATPAAKAAQPVRTAAADSRDDDAADGNGPAGAPARGAKVRSRRPTGAQELRALRLREDARQKNDARGQARSATHGASGSAAGAGARARPSAAPAKAAATARSAPPAVEFRLTCAYIALDNLLKLTGTAPSGGAAKALAAEGAVKVDGKIELRKTCKIRAGQLVQTGEARIRVLAAVV